MTRPDNIVLAGTVGSTAYGLAHEDSDIDTLGVFIAPLHKVLGLDGPNYVSGKKASWVGHEPDETYHEIGKYINLALRCNPTILEILWLNEHTIYEPAGISLVAARKLFLSEPAVRGAYGAYAFDQAKKLMQRQDQRSPKHGRHCLRLLLMGTELLSTGTMSIDRSNDRDYLFEIGDLSLSDPDKFYKEFERKKDHFDAVESVLPHKPDRGVFEWLLPRIRLNTANKNLEVGA